MEELALLAPMSGWSLPLEEVPDPVFAQGMAGVGYAIDPVESLLRAPCAGVVSQLHRCHHALTLKHRSGLEVLMHVGLDSVRLEGRGFRPQVREGDQVEAGQILLEFEADEVARNCLSLITVVVIPEVEAVSGLQGTPGKVTQGQPWLKLQVRGALSGAQGEAEQAGNWLRLPNPSGIHARPAARLVGLVKELPGPIYLESRQRKASARSLVALLGLGLAQGDECRLLHRDLSQQQLAELEQEISQGLGDDLSQQPQVAERAPVALSFTGDTLAGVVASGGVAVGRVFRWQRTEFELPEGSEGEEAERRSWSTGLSQARQQVAGLRERAPHPERAIFSAHLELLEDPEMLDQVEASLKQGNSAARAWQKVYQDQAELLERLPNPLLAARAGDLRDVGERLLGILLGQATPAAREFPEDCIVFAEDLTPSDTVQLDPQKVSGLCLARGGPSSHVAILSRSLGIPSLCALGPGLLRAATSDWVILDAEEGRLLLKPTAEELTQARSRVEQLRQRRESERARAHQPACLASGQAIEVAVNIGKAQDLTSGLEGGAEGVGLFRTEFYFHSLEQEPSLEAQVKVYQEIASMLGPERRLVARLLDVGGDKPLSYVPMPHEENPFLGVRGIRLFTRKPDLFRRQIQALLQVSDQCKLALLVPMVASLREWRAIRAEILALAGDRSLEVGVMIEVPSAALLAEQLAPEVDFFSIGTNDLTQYTLAIDRGHPDLAGEVDPLHPALLHLMARVGEAAARHGRWVGVCGGAAQDSEAIPLLLGMNVSELSVSPPAVAGVKAEVRRWTLEQCQSLVRDCLGLAEACEVRSLVKERRP